MNPPKRIVCPQCIEIIDADSVAWVDVKGESTDGHKPRAGSKLMQRMRPKARYANEREWTEWTSRRLEPWCPVNNHPLPADILENESKLIGLVGATGASKSHFLASAIDALTKANLEPYGVYARISPDSVRDYLEIYGGLVRQHARIEPTFRDSDVPPIVVNFRNTSMQKTWNLVFFDAPGEELMDRSSMAVHHKHLAIADALLILVPPESIYDLRLRLGYDDGVLDPHMTGAMLDEVLRLRRAKKAVASLLLCKADQLGVLDDFPLEVLEPLDHRQMFRSTFLERLAWESAEISQFLERNGAYAITSMMADEFGEVCFSAVSATGCEEEEDLYPDFSPRRCLEPILFLANGMGLLNRLDS